MQTSINFFWHFNLTKLEHLQLCWCYKWLRLLLKSIPILTDIISCENNYLLTWFHQQVAFMPYRVNGQYIMEGLAASFMFSLGGLGFIVLDKSNAFGLPKLNRFLLLTLGFICVSVAFFCCRVFMKMKLPWVLSLFLCFFIKLETLKYGHKKGKAPYSTM